VHPDDEAVFERFEGQHTFELAYPPPAFIGNPDAPVVVLLANGGRSRRGEFDDPGAAGAFYAALRGEKFTLEDVHGSEPLRGWVAAGLAVRVNSVAYRSERLSAEPANRAVAEHLPSVALHRRWLREDVLPAARAGKRFVIAHRRGVWGLERSEASETVIFTANPISPQPSKAATDKAREWLAKRGHPV